MACHLTSRREARLVAGAWAPWRQALALCAAALVSFALPGHALAQETVCARVKIEIKQELTLERQAFDAEMKINNTTTSDVIQNVSVVVKVTDELGTPVLTTDDPNNLSAKFFVRIASKQNISDVDGTGSVNPATTSIIDWLIIPAPGAAGTSPLGKKYLVGATLKYRYAGEDQTLEVSPDVITVKPLPLLTLDYFLTRDVVADDPLTPAIEPPEPFTLGVRVKNTGYAAAKALKIDSAQPKIIENSQGLVINFTLTGSYLNDAPAQNTLLLNFGDVAPSSTIAGRWIMETTLAGRFTEFSAKFTHADELGGTLTSLLQATNAHLLIRDVRVDLPGRDFVRDFLAQDGDVIRLYESEGLDTVVTDRSGVGQLTAGTDVGGTASYRLVIPATAGFVYVKLPDPFGGQKALGKVMRSDAKVMLAENVWLSKTRNEQTHLWEYWVNLFDVNTTGVYDAAFQAPTAAARPPQIQFIPDRTTKEQTQVSFIVEASSPDGKPVTISAAPLPAGAHFTMQATDPQTPALARAVFDWTPAKGTIGNYLIVYTATDGTLAAALSAGVKVESSTPPPGPATPTIVSPTTGSQVQSLRPVLGVQPSTDAQDPTRQLQFEIYKDEAMTQAAGTGMVDKALAQPTTWQPTTDLQDNTTYWWRARAFDGTQMYSAWANGRFFVNLANDPPDSFNLVSPAPGVQVQLLQPVLAWNNGTDRDGDPLSYSVQVFRDSALTDLAVQSADLPAAVGGVTSWQVSAALTNHATYHWRVTAQDPSGARTNAMAQSFTVDTGNTAPTAPVPASPPVGGQSATPTTVLTITNGVDQENDLITYVFELDTVSSFDSSDKRSSGQVIQSAGQTTSWTVSNLIENKHYWWRVKAQDGRAESAWVSANFLMNAVNEAPAAPTVKNPGDGAWTASLQPTLEANVVLDPEADAVSYQFEVYRDAGLGVRVAEGTSSSTSWVVSIALADKTTHWWRVRSMDPQGATSAWSASAILYVSSAPYQDPTIQVTQPSTLIEPTIVTSPTGNRKRVTIQWEGTDPNIEASVALYWSTTSSGFGGSLIVDGLHQLAGTQSGSYDWDVTDLAPGSYYVYGLIYDTKGFGRAYANGAVVIVNPTPAGSIEVAGNNLATSESGAQSSFTVRLGRAPTANVTVPITSTRIYEGLPNVNALTFTPQSWATAQTVAVTGQADCVLDKTQAYQILVGKAASVDPDYMGLSGQTVNANNADATDRKLGVTSSPDIFVCRFALLSQQQVSTKLWEYTFAVEVTNIGLAAVSVQATLTGMAGGITVIDPNTSVGAIEKGETIKSGDAITIRSNKQLSQPERYMQTNAGWTVTIQR